MNLFRWLLSKRGYAKLPKDSIELVVFIRYALEKGDIDAAKKVLVTLEKLLRSHLLITWREDY